MKTCKQCKETKSLDKFPVNKASKKDGRQTRCSDCRNQNAKKYYEENRAEILNRNKHDPISWRLRAYNLQNEDFNILLIEQEGKCAICLREGKLCVDHCHSSGKVRGLLCRNCNVALGHFKDNVNLLKIAITYLSEKQLQSSDGS